MTDRGRFSTVEVEGAVDRGTARRVVRLEGKVLEVYFPAQNTPRDIAHGLGVVPTGYILLLESGGTITAVDVAAWTPDLAYLASSHANARARLYFVQTVEVPSESRLTVETPGVDTAGDVLTDLTAGLNIDAAQLLLGIIATLANVIFDTVGVGGSNATHAIATFRGQYFSPMILVASSGAAQTVDWSLGNERRITLDAACTLTFSNPVDGGRYCILLRQDGTGGRTVSWPASVVWPGGTAPTLTATANATDLTTFMWDAALGKYIGAFNLNYPT